MKNIFIPVYKRTGGKPLFNIKVYYKYLKLPKDKPHIAMISNSGVISLFPNRRKDESKSLGKL